MKTYLSAVLACTAFAALPAAAQMASGQPMAAADASMMSPSDYVMQAGASDMFEITSSRTVLMSTHDPKVRRFAQQMITDHTKSTTNVKAAASKDHVMPGAPRMNSMQADMVKQLKAAHGTGRDQLYMQQQTQAHQMALQLQQSYAANGTAPHLKMTAGMIVPVVQNHLGMLQSGGMSGM